MPLTEPVLEEGSTVGDDKDDLDSGRRPSFLIYSYSKMLHIARISNLKSIPIPQGTKISVHC